MQVTNDWPKPLIDCTTYFDYVASGKPGMQVFLVPFGARGFRSCTLTAEDIETNDEYDSS